MKKIAVIFAGLSLLAAIPCSAATITVDPNGSADYTTIQAGINAAVSGQDTVIVADGTYTGDGNRNIQLTKENIIVRSMNGPASCIIDCEDMSRGMYIDANDVELNGFTIKNGYTGDNGGGIYFYGGNNVVISDCIITNNEAKHGGGGIGSTSESLLTVTNCTFSGNSAYDGGGLHGCDGAITNCTITGNYAALRGGGLHDCYGAITNCTITGNNAEGYHRFGAGLYDCYGAITNCIIWGNTASNSSCKQLSSSAVPTYSCIQYWTGGGIGNISGNPLFVDISEDPNDRDLHLDPGSHCIDAGTNSPAGGLPATGMDGNPRPIDGNNDGIVIADMGAYEAYPSSEPVIWLSNHEFYFTADEGGADPNEQTLTITNIGGGTLNWTITEGCDWLTVSPASGSSTGEDNDITLSVDITGLSKGGYCQLVISDPLSVNNPQIVNIALVVDGIYVPQDLSSIQSAIDIVGNDDTIIVAPGTYYENISFIGKNIVLTSIDPTDPAVVAATIIDGGGSGSVVTFSGTETSACELTGFTITNGNAGYGGGYGGGIFGGSHPNYTHATITNCTITGNSADSYGGGLYDCYGVITNCTITGNTADWGGGGLAYCNGAITNCTITGNWASEYGGGLHYCDGAITNCTITGNYAGFRGGGLYNCSAAITSSIIWGNTAYSGDQLYGSSTPTYSCIQGSTFGGMGNISDDPLFVTGPLGDYYLSQTAAGQGADSPCVDAGSDTATNLGMDKYTTRTDKVADDGLVDMGYHYLDNIADLNDDGYVNLEDILLMALQWLDVPSEPSADIAPEPLDNFVDYQDFAVIGQNWQWPEQ